MSSAPPYFSIDEQFKLHYQRMRGLAGDGSLRMNFQDVRQDFILHCVQQGKSLQPAPDALGAYVANQERGLPVVDRLVAQADSVQSSVNLEKQKLAILFSHLAIVNYELNGLTIEPVAVADLIAKLDDINWLPAGQVHEYLMQLLAEKIPGYQQMSMAAFLNAVHQQYQQEGVKFHCYLRENFFKPIQMQHIKEAAPSLNYFMPSVFCQQHVNSCEVATVLTMLKKVTTNFEQMQAVCFADNTSLPPAVKEAQLKIQKLAQQFEEFLENSQEHSPAALQKITKNYVQEINVLQKEMEKSFGQKFDSKVVLFLKKAANHTWATLKHLFATRIIPEGFSLTAEEVKEKTAAELNPFQQGLVRGHMKEIFKADMVSNLHKPEVSPQEKQDFTDSIQQLFLFGKSRVFSESVVCGHSSIMDIDKSGYLKIIEHKNAKPEETLLAQDCLAHLNIKGSTLNTQHAVNQIMESIDYTLHLLGEERNNILKVQKGAKPGSNIQVELSSMLEKKVTEIEELQSVKDNLILKLGVEQGQKRCPVTTKFNRLKQQVREALRSGSEAESDEATLNIRKSPG